jgi:tetratricopeptide (TPR) repeat protein
MVIARADVFHRGRIVSRQSANAPYDGPQMNTVLRLPSVAILLAGLIAFSSCSESKEKPSATTQAPAVTTPKFTSLTQVPESERQELDAFGRELETALRAKDLPKVKAAFRAEGMIEQFMIGVTISNPKIREFKTGMQKGLQRSIEFIATRWSEGDTKYKHLVIHEGVPKLRFRFYMEESGITFMDLLVTRGANGKLGIVDAFNHGMGSGIVEQSRQAALPALMELDRGFLERMFDGGPKTDFKALEQFGEMSKHFRNKDYQGVVEAFQKLPPDLKNKLTPTAIHITALQQLGDEEAYKNGLREAAKVHNSASFQFMLLDLYILAKDYAKAIECLDAFMASVERDAVLLVMKGTLQSNQGNPAAALTTVKEALTLEPDSYPVHNLILDVLLAAKDHAAVADSLRFLEKGGTLQFKGTLTDPIWEDFLKSPASAPWR